MPGKVFEKGLKLKDNISDHNDPLAHTRRSKPPQRSSVSSLASTPPDTRRWWSFNGAGVLCLLVAILSGLVNILTDNETYMHKIETQSKN